jgi:hypothetical protein
MWASGCTWPKGYTVKKFLTQLSPQKTYEGSLREQREKWEAEELEREKAEAEAKATQANAGEVNE